MDTPIFMPPRRIIRSFLVMPLLAALLFVFTGMVPANAATNVATAAGKADVTLTAFTFEVIFAGDDAVVLGDIVPSQPTTKKPTGTVSLLPDAANTPLDTYVLTSGDLASSFGFSAPPASVGTHYYRVAYSGDANFAPRTHRFSIVVDSGPRSKTSLTVSPSGSSAAGQPVTLTAQVSALTGPMTHQPPTGEVSFRVDGVEIAWGYMGKDWRTSVTTAAIDPGKHVITVEYLDQLANFGSSTSPGTTHTVTSALAEVRTELHSSHHGDIVRGQAVTVQAVIAPRLATGATPTGWVQFYDWNTKVGPPVPLANGKASYKYTGLTVGKHILNAKYLGSSRYLSRDTPARTVTVLR